MELSEIFQPILISLGRFFLILAVSYILALFSLPYLLKMIAKAGIVKENYRGEKIPSAGGLVFISLLPVIAGLGLALGVATFSNPSVFLFLFVILGMGFLGFVDDQLGNHDVKGYKGHLTKLLKEHELTTGGYKLLCGGVIALVFSLGTAKLLDPRFELLSMILNFLLICSAANTINLFDLRPGRAGKVYVLGFIIILVFSKSFENHIGLFLPILAILFAYLPLDLRAKVMLGDLGSNLLGASLGMMMAWMFSDLSKLVALILIIGLQIASEKYSFSEIINNHQWLRALDDFGRRKKL
jgi:UDP-GlcNAc:undecaprenyl-phosphate GlcNAc-1-phosphate transferase